MANSRCMMRAAVFRGRRSITTDMVPRPELADGDILLKIRACGICGSDLHTYERGIFEDMGIPIEGGRIMGHEFAGEVAEINGEAPGLRIGDRVCSTAIGANAEYLKLPAAALPLVLPIQEGVGFEEAATVEPLATSLHAVNLAAPLTGETHVIIGAGIIGLGILQVLRATACVKTIVCDTSDARLDLAAELGADLTVNAGKQDSVKRIMELTGKEHVLFVADVSGLVDTVYDSAGLSERFTGTPALQQAAILTKQNGKIISLGLFEKTAKVDHNLIVLKGITLCGSMAWTEDEFRQSMDLVGSGRIGRKPLISHRFSLEEASQAYETQLRVEEAMKVMIVP